MCWDGVVFCGLCCREMGCCVMVTLHHSLFVFIHFICTHILITCISFHRLVQSHLFDTKQYKYRWYYSGANPIEFEAVMCYLMFVHYLLPF